MFQAQYLFKGNAVYSPWMPREGDDIQATFDVVEISGLTLKIELYQKNKETSGNGVPVASPTISTTSTGRKLAEWAGVLELIRFKFTADGGTNDYEYALFRMLSPVWFDAVKAS